MSISLEPVIFTDERSWWFTNNDSTFSSKELSEVCIGFENSVARVKSTYLQDGPFHGLLGFSQGAAFAAILCAFMESDFRKFCTAMVGSHQIELEISVLRT